VAEHRELGSRVTSLGEVPLAQGMRFPGKIDNLR